MPPRTRTRGRALPAVIVGLLALAVLEIWVLVQVGRWIGPGPTLLVLLAEAMLGAWLVWRAGGQAWAALSRGYGPGQPLGTELGDAALILVGGLLLMLPGFLTDMLALVVLLPFTRPLARRLLASVLARRAVALGLVQRSAPPGYGQVIEGEVVEGEVVRDETGEDDAVEGRVERGSGRAGSGQAGSGQAGSGRAGSGRASQPREP